MTISDQDFRERRCPRLGHGVNFEYCRTQEGARVCPRILNCWWETFDVRGFLQENLSHEQYMTLETPREGGSKMDSLLDLIEKAKRA